MLRLLTNLASDSEAQSISALMSDDPATAMQCARLIEISRKQFSVSDAFDDGDEVDADWIAGFIDGTLVREEQEQFEQRCWNSEGLLREVVSLWRLEFDPRASEALCLDDARLCLLPDEIQELFQKTRPEMDAFIAGATGQVIETLRQGSQIQIEVARRSVRSKCRPWWLMVGTIAAAAIAIASVNRWINFRKDNDKPLRPESIAQDDTSTNPDSILNPNVIGPQIDQVVEQGAPESAVQQSINPIPDNSQLIDRKEDSGDSIVRTPMPESSEAPEERTPSLSPKTESSQKSSVVNLAEWFEWTESRGVAAVRDETSDQWRGFLATRSYPTRASSCWLQVVTFNDSFLSGNAKDEVRWTADANTTFKLTQRETDPQSPLICQIDQGRLAVENLQKNQQLEFQLDTQTYVVEVKEDNTSLVVQCVDRGLIVGLHRGLVRVSDQQVSRSAWIAIATGGMIDNIRPSSSDRWYRESKRDQMPKDLTSAFNHAPQFLAQLNDLTQSGDVGDQLFATRALLRCRAADQLPPEDNNLLAMLNSNQERVRESLIQWLHQQCISTPRLGMAVTKRLATIQELPPAEKQKFEEWFASAARGLSYNDRLLNQLKTSLSNQSRPVVRQAAKFFLQGFLNESLEFYSAINPGPANGRLVTEVRRRVTQKQQLMNP